MWSLALFIMVPLVIFLAIGLAERRKVKTLSDFYLYSGELQPRGFWASLASTNLSVSNFLVVCAIWGFAYGWSSIVWIGLAWTLALIFFFTFVVRNEKVRGFIENRSNMGTLHEFLGTQYGTGDKQAKYLRMVASAISISSFWLALTLELVIGADFFLLLSQTASTHQLLVILLAVTIAVYASLGGFRSVVRTDLWQLFFIVIGMIAAVVAMSQISFLDNYAAHFGSGVVANLTGAGFLLIVPLLVFGVVWFTVGMDSWQRCAATRNAKISKVYTIMMIVFLLAVTTVCVYVGILDRTMEYGAGYNPFLEVMGKWLELSTTQPIFFVLVGVILAAFISAMISTTDTQLVVLSQSFIADIILLRRGVVTMEALGEDDQRRYVTLSRVLVLALAIGVIPAYLVVKTLGLSLESVFFIAYAIQVPLFPVILAVLVLKRAPDYRAAIAAIIVGASLTLVFSIPAALGLAAGQDIEGNTVLLYMAPVIGLFASGLTLLLVNISIPKRSNAAGGV